MRLLTTQLSTKSIEASAMSRAQSPESWEYMDAEIEPSNGIHICMQLACWQREGC